MKRFVAILTASGALAAAGAALAPVAFADPYNPHASCVGALSTFFGSGFIGTDASQTAGLPGPDDLGVVGRTDCTS